MKKNLGKIIALAIMTAGILNCGIVWGADGVTDANGSLKSDEAGVYVWDKTATSSIAMGKEAGVYILGKSTSFKPTKGQFIIFNNKNEKSTLGGIAIGEKAFAMDGSIDIGIRNYVGNMGGVALNTGYRYINNGVDQRPFAGVGSTTIGTNSYSGGSLTSTFGAFNMTTTDYGQDSSSNFTQNAGATIFGSLNSNESYNTNNSNSGVSNSIVGLANKAQNSNGALLWGTGNTITNSQGELPVSPNLSWLFKDVSGVQNDAINSLQTREDIGGSVMAVGGGNSADYAGYSQLMGVQNTLKGTPNNISKYNFLDGYRNKATNVSHVTAIGSNNTINENADNNVIVGDKHNIAAGKSNNIILGSADNELEHNASNAVVIGYNANVMVDDGVALGANSIANTDKGSMGWALSGVEHENNLVWRATAAAVSVGDFDKGITRQITGVAAGTQDTDAVNVAQLKQAAITITAGDGITVVKNGSEYTISANIKGSATDTDSVTVGKGSSDGSVAGGESGSDNALVIGAETKPTTFAADNGKVDIKPSETLNINGDGGNITTEASGSTINVKLNKDVKVDSVTINNGGPVINNEGIDMKDHKITNVTDGEISADSKDAVNGSQLYATNQSISNLDNRVTNIDNRINKLDGRIDKVGAGAAALAALHPLEFDPDDKWNFAAGVGNYRGENAAAIGAFYRPDEKVMFSIGGTVGNGENMVNAGISFALDRTPHVTNSRTAMAKEVVELRSQVAELTGLVKQMAMVNGLNIDNSAVMFPDVPENHWAYDYVKGLVDRGVIEGYPNGEFTGDRSITRYEFAAMLYKAMMKGVNLDSRAVVEFAPELGRIRVDRIAGKDNDEHKIERVRVNRGEDRDVYGSKIVRVSKTK